MTFVISTGLVMLLIRNIVGSCVHGIGGLNFYRYTYCPCSCYAGYEGIYCSSEINECASNPCENKASCTDHVAKYTCICVDGYAGTNCEINIACHSNPCSNGGICTDDQPSGYTCHCPLGFTGHRCEKDPIVFVRPNISLPETNIVSEGNSLFLVPCYAEGIPVPSITWESLGQPSFPKNAIQLAHFLVFKNVSTIDAGHYICTAKNKVGTDRKVVQVIVRDAPKIFVPPVTSDVMSGHSKNFTCIANGHPKPSIKWTYKMYTKHTTDMPSHRLYNNGSVLTLYYSNTQESGQLTCTARNEFGEDHISVSVIVRSPHPVG